MPKYCRVNPHIIRKWLNKYILINSSAVAQTCLTLHLFGLFFDNGSIPISMMQTINSVSLVRVSRSKVFLLSVSPCPNRWKRSGVSSSLWQRKSRRWRGSTAPSSPHPILMRVRRFLFVCSHFLVLHIHCFVKEMSASVQREFLWQFLIWLTHFLHRVESTIYAVWYFFLESLWHVKKKVKT